MKDVITEKDIRLKLLMCCGSEDYYKHPMFKNILFSEGIILMVDLCNAHWLLVDMLANIALLRSQHEFITIKVLKSPDQHSCCLIFEDGNNNAIRKPIPYHYTDYPLSNYKVSVENKEAVHPAITFFYRNGVLYLPSEH